MYNNWTLEKMRGRITKNKVNFGWYLHFGLGHKNGGFSELSNTVKTVAGTKMKSPV